MIRLGYYVLYLMFCFVVICWTYLSRSALERESDAHVTWWMGFSSRAKSWIWCSYLLTIMVFTNRGLRNRWQTTLKTRNSSLWNFNVITASRPAFVDVDHLFKIKIVKFNVFVCFKLLICQFFSNPWLIWISRQAKRSWRKSGKDLVFSFLYYATIHEYQCGFIGDFIVLKQ